MSESNIWRYRGHRLKKLEWGLWTALGEPGRYFLCYRPRGRHGPIIRRWAIVGPGLTVEDLRQHVRTVRSQIQARKRWFRRDRVIVVESINPVDPQPPVLLKEKDIRQAYVIIGVWFE